MIPLGYPLIGGQFWKIKVPGNRTVINVDCKCVIAGCRIKKTDSSALPLIVVAEENMGIGVGL